MSVPRKIKSYHTKSLDEYQVAEDNRVTNHRPEKQHWTSHFLPCSPNKVRKSEKRKCVALLSWMGKHGKTWWFTKILEKLHNYKDVWNFILCHRASGEKLLNLVVPWRQVIKANGSYRIETWPMACLPNLYEEGSQGKMKMCSRLILQLVNRISCNRFLFCNLNDCNLK